MATFNRDEVKGKIDQAVGKGKERLGRDAGDPILEQEGADQRMAGDIEHGAGKARRKFGESMAQGFRGAMSKLMFAERC